MSRTLPLLVGLLIGCADPEAPVPEPPTFHTNIAPILHTHCSNCHTEEGMNPGLIFQDAEVASAIAPWISETVSSGQMPPFHAQTTEDCPTEWTWKNDPRLNDQDASMLHEWADAGGPIGDIDDATPLIDPPSSNLTDANQEVFPEEAWVTSPVGATEDEFICFSIDPGIDEQQWLEAFQVLPEDLAVVHHVLVGIDPTGASAELAGEDGHYDCFGGFEVDATFVGGWIPGASPIDMPSHSAVRVAPEARLVLQMHYHLAEDAHSDATGLALRWAEDTPVREAYFELHGNASEQSLDGHGLQPGPSDDGDPVFLIPPGETDHTETMSFRDFDSYPRNSQVFLVANHMHYVGTDMRMWLTRGAEAPSEDDTCLLHTPHWDFAWQQFYQYDLDVAPGPEIYPGDTLWMECVYDNSLENPNMASALAQAGEDEPITVGLGNGSLDEMCIGVLGEVFDVPMEVADATHGGTLESQVSSEGYGFEDVRCSGPTSIAIDDSGNLSGVAACGLDVLGLLATVEYSLTGSLTTWEATGEDLSQVGTGEVSLSVMGVGEPFTGVWEASLSAAGQLSLHILLSGDVGGVGVDFDSVLTVEPL